MNELAFGWLCPTGELQECSPYDHIATARSIADKLDLPSVDARTGRLIHEDDKLMEIGYIYIGISSLGIRELRIGWRRDPTPEQVRFLRPYFENPLLPVNEYDKVRWEMEVEN